MSECGTIDKTAPAIIGDNEMKARNLVIEAHANGGLAPLDIERFWADQDEARKDPFGAHIKQVALGIKMSWECVFEELGIPEDFWKIENDPEWRFKVSKEYNDLSEKIVGRRLLEEKPPVPNEDKYPATKMLHDVFEAKNEWHNGSWWLQQSVHSADELEALLDRIDNLDLRSFVFPPEWEERKRDLISRGIKPPSYRGQRGPVTFATSVFGSESFIFLILENPDLAARFRDTIIRVMLELARIKDEDAGLTESTRQRGFSFADDNCCLLTAEMYEFFGYPVLKALFDTYAPKPEDWRYQHSDSSMEHLLPILSKLNFTMVNFGPSLTVESIRNHMPKTIVQGQLAPFTFSRNEEEKIVQEFLRDYDMAKDKRGLLFATAGSINNGSRLTGMRLIMAAIQKYGRY